MNVLQGKRILLVEDEAIIAFAMEDILADLGCEVIGPALRLEDAKVLAGSDRIDAAILDVNLNNLRSYPVAEVLERRGVPFLFATGYDNEGIEWSGRPAELLPKPYRREQVEAALTRLLD
ncbi:MAG: response regulator [Sphingomicrobium sp.]